MSDDGSRFFEAVRLDEFAAKRAAVAVETSAASSEFKLTDIGNADAFVAWHGDRFRYVRAWKTWLVWDSTRWRRDTTGHAQEAAKATLKRRLEETIANGSSGDAKRALTNFHSEPAIRHLLTVAESDPAIALLPDAFDRDPWLLSCANGTVDLRTGQLRPNRASDLISRGTDIFYEQAEGLAQLRGRCPRWLRFLDEVFAGDEELIRFVHRAVGYSLTGVTHEDALFVAHGPGCNGKTTFIEAVKRIMGDYVMTANTDSFMRARGDRQIRSDIARLQHARLVVAAETGSGGKLDEGTVKMLTGGDTIAARPLYQSEVEFTPRFKLWLVTNHLPRVDGDDDAIWRRIRCIPFAVSFKGQEDSELEDVLIAEAEGILTWAVIGAMVYSVNKLGTAPAVEQATSEYHETEDVLGTFITERCEVGVDAKVETTELRLVYERFCRDAEIEPLSPTQLGIALKRRGIPRQDGHPRYYLGIALDEAA